MRDAQRYAKEISKHREILKRRLYEDQAGRCALTGRQTRDLEMHEWLVQRNHLPILRLQLKIYHPINCILLTHEAHARIDGNARDLECFEYKLKTYTREDIQNWLHEINLKTFPTLEQWINQKQPFLPNSNYD